MTELDKTKTYLDNELLKIDETRRKVSALSEIQDELFNSLKDRLPKVSEKTTDWIFDYVFNGGNDICLPHIKAGLLTDQSDVGQDKTED